MSEVLEIVIKPNKYRVKQCFKPYCSHYAYCKVAGRSAYDVTDVILQTPCTIITISNFKVCSNWSEIVVACIYYVVLAVKQCYVDGTLVDSSRDPSTNNKLVVETSDVLNYHVTPQPQQLLQRDVTSRSTWCHLCGSWRGTELAARWEIMKGKRCLSVEVIFNFVKFFLCISNNCVILLRSGRVGILLLDLV